MISSKKQLQPINSNNPFLETLEELLSDNTLHKNKEMRTLVESDDKGYIDLEKILKHDKFYEGE